MAKRQVDRTEEEKAHRRELNRKHKRDGRKRKSEKKKAAEGERDNRRYAYTAYVPPNSDGLESGDNLVFPSRNRRSDLLAHDQEMEALLVNAIAMMDMNDEGDTH